MNAICLLGIAPVRKEPDDRSEMVTQLLFGEQCRVVEEYPGWYRIITKFDAYPGYVDKLQISSINYTITNKYIINIPYSRYSNSWLPMGAELQEVDVEQHPGLLDSTADLEQLRSVPADRRKLMRTSAMLMKSPYLWGGRTTFGIDCSGLTQVVFKTQGIFIPRDASQQATRGTALDLADTRSGDLAFFSKPGKTSISHVGLVNRKGREISVVHASGWVKEEPLGPEGIIDQNGHLTHTLLFARDLISG